MPLGLHGKQAFSEDKKNDQRRDHAESFYRWCDFHGCCRTPTRFTGSQQVGWLHFCSRHANECQAITRYLSTHPHAMFPGKR